MTAPFLGLSRSPARGRRFPQAGRAGRLSSRAHLGPPSPGMGPGSENTSMGPMLVWHRHGPSALVYVLRLLRCRSL